jgi:hypothetical protein
MVMILLAEIVDIRGADNRTPHVSGHPDQAFVGLLLTINPILLNLEIDILGPKYLN